MRRAIERKQNPMRETAIQILITAKSEPFNEGIQKGGKFTPNETNGLIQIRGDLMSKGFQDTTIARMVAHEFGRTAGSLREKIRKLRIEGTISANPNILNKNDYSDHEIELIIITRNSLAKQGYNDKAIAKIIGGQKGRSVDSLYSKILKLERDGIIPINSNKIELVNFTNSEIVLLKKRRAELICRQMGDKAIARELAGVFGRSIDSVYAKIRFLLKKGLLPHNPNALKRTSQEEVGHIVERRAILMENMSDLGIAKEIASETGERVQKIYRNIRNLVKAGILPKNKNKHREPSYLKEIPDEKLVRYTKKIINEKEIKTLKDFKINEHYLYDVLRKRGLLEQIGIERRDARARYFDSMKDAQLIRIAKAYTAKKGISKRGELLSGDVSLYGVLKKRGLLEKAGFKRKRPLYLSCYSRQSQDQLIEFAKELVREEQIFTSTKLRRSNGALYSELWKRGLLDRIGLNIKRTRRWKDMSDDSLLDYAKKTINKSGITGKTALRKGDAGLHAVLSKRKLLNCLEFKEKRPENKSWKDMDDEYLIDYAKKFMEQNSISSRHELEKTEARLYQVLRKRHLLSRIGFREKRVRWEEMSNAQTIEYANAFIEQKGIRTRTDLRNNNSPLYIALLKKKIIGLIDFEQKKRNWAQMNRTQIIRYAKRFIMENGIRTRGALRKADSGLYKILIHKGLVDHLGFADVRKKRRNWKKMEDTELIRYTKKFIIENGINGRFELQKKDGGLRIELAKRGLMDKVFSEIEQSKDQPFQSGLAQAALAMEKFGGEE